MRYPVIALPPSAAGADHDSATDAFPAEPTTPDGAPGTVADGVTAADGVESGPVPTALIAATLKVYEVPFVNPVTVYEVDADPVDTGACATPPTYGVTRYPVIAEPPFEDGADHDSTTERFPADPTTADGAPGIVPGVTAADGAESGPVPTALLAATRNVYAVPLVNPVTVYEVDAEPVGTGACATPPTYGVTRYPVIADPPFEDGAVHDTATCPFPAVPETPVGAPGAPATGVTAADAAESGPVPTALIAATRNVYAVPFVNPVTVYEVDADPVGSGVCATPPTYGVTRYAVIALPPSEAGADHDNATEPFPADPTTPDGAPGAVAFVPGAATTTSSKSVAFVASFQSWTRWRLSVRV
jgi:hypothetical protein